LKPHVILILLISSTATLSGLYLLIHAQSVADLYIYIAFLAASLTLLVIGIHTLLTAIIYIFRGFRR